MCHGPGTVGVGHISGKNSLKSMPSGGNWGTARREEFAKETQVLDEWSQTESRCSGNFSRKAGEEMPSPEVLGLKHQKTYVRGVWQLCGGGGPGSSLLRDHVPLARPPPSSPPSFLPSLLSLSLSFFLQLWATFTIKAFPSPPKLASHPFSELAPSSPCWPLATIGLLSITAALLFLDFHRRCVLCYVLFCVWLFHFV